MREARIRRSGVLALGPPALCLLACSRQSLSLPQATRHKHWPRFSAAARAPALAEDAAPDVIIIIGEGGGAGGAADDGDDELPPPAAWARWLCALLRAQL